MFNIYFYLIKQNELVDKAFFEIVHPSDSKQIKDQLAYTENNHCKFKCFTIFFIQLRRRSLIYCNYLKANYGTVNNFMINKTKIYTTGDRRSFVCRIRTGSNLLTKSNERVILNATDNFKGKI